MALTYAVLLTIAGAVMLLLIYVFLGLLPSYSFAAVAPVFPSSPAATLDIIDGGYDLGVAAALSDDSVMPAFLVSSRDDVLQLLLIISTTVLVLLAAGGAWAGWLVAGRLLRPLQDINAAARRASRGELDHRLALGGPHDEISDLADTFDDMLAAIERSVEAHRRFAANASHELRTPLATSRAMLDVALASGHEAPHALLKRLRETNERSIATVEALLDLAEIGSATVTGTSSAVDLGQIAGDVAAEHREEALRQGVEIESRIESASVQGDPRLLRQLMTNLVQNGIRHNVPGGFVTVSTRVEERSAVVRIENSGPVVDDEALQLLTDPFYRGGGRTSGASAVGRGLGLSIVAAIADRIGGELSIEARPAGGLRVTVRAPDQPSGGSSIVAMEPSESTSEIRPKRFPSGSSR